MSGSVSGVPDADGVAATTGVRRRPRRKRLSAEEGRQALLEAGRALAHEQPAGPALEHIRLTDVAERAGVSVGALYHYWDSQDAYRDDLLDEVFAPSRFDPPDDAGTGEGLGAIDLVELLRVGAEAELERLRTSPDLRVLMAMWAAADPAIEPRVAEHFRVVGEDWAAFYEAVFRAHGLEVRPPFTYEQVATLLAAVGDGLAVRAGVDPAAVPTDLDVEGEGRWTLLGAALAALLPAFSRPIGGDATFADHLAAVRDLVGRADVADR